MRLSSARRPNWWRMPAAALACALALAAGARVAMGPRGASVHVRWTRALDDEARRAIETRLQLTNGRRLDDLTWQYDLVDPSTNAIGLIVADAAVADTHGIDRSRGALDPAAPRTGRRLRSPHGDAIVSAADYASLATAAFAVLALVFGASGRAVTFRGIPAAVGRRLRLAGERPAAAETPSVMEPPAPRPRLWTPLALAAVAPFVAALCVTLWRTPPPITEAVALFEDVLEQPMSRFWSPNDTYYRPLFQAALAGAWTLGDIDATLGSIKLLTVVPVALLVIVFVWHLRPRSPLEAAAAGVGAVVLIGHRGFRDNLEIVLPYTIVGMCMAAIVWAVLEREPRRWSAALVVMCTLVAIGFKEQGLVILPAIVVAWWMGAPGATRPLAATAVAVGVAYVAFRLSGSAAWSPFEQDIGFGFTEMTRQEAAARFGAFPYGIYAYNAAGTVGNVLLSEPTRGVFQAVRAFTAGETPPRLTVEVASSAALTVLIGWWGLRLVGRRSQDPWSADTRVFVALIVATVASGALSFNYSRDRLGGMAVVFYALAASYAVRAAAVALLRASRTRVVAATCALLLLSAAWSTRAIATLEYARGHAWANQMEWFVLLPEREVTFARRATYQRIMASMIEAGRDPSAPRPTRYPGWFARLIG